MLSERPPVDVKDIDRVQLRELVADGHPFRVGGEARFDALHEFFAIVALAVREKRCNFVRIQVEFLSDVPLLLFECGGTATRTRVEHTETQLVAFFRRRART